MKVLITGANGMVARAAIRHCTRIGDEVIALTRQQLDIADPDAVSGTLREVRPNVTLNCAAYTDVDGAEANADEARAVNTIGVGYLAQVANETGARLVTISTDYVFDGSNAGFYTEDDTPNPRGVYAITKYDGEQAALKENADAVVARSGWIFGESGTNFLSVMHRILAEGKKIKAIADAFGTPTYASDLATRLREIAGTDASGVFHVPNSGEGTSYLGFAKKVCEIGGFDPALIEPVYSKDLNRPAPRPSSSKLASVRLGPLPDWEDALGRFLNSGKW